MVFINTTGFMGELFLNFTTYVSGSTFITLLAIIILLFGLLTMFRIPFEASLILLLPVILVFMAWSAGGFLAVGVVTVMVLGILLAKNWIVR